MEPQAHGSSSREVILVVSRDEKLADVRKTVLEAAGFEVIPAQDAGAVRAACRLPSLKLVMLGHSLLPSEKRKVWFEVKKLCTVPVLELHQNEKPELKSPAYFHQSQAADDFLRTVMRILSRQDSN